MLLHVVLLLMHALLLYCYRRSTELLHARASASAVVSCMCQATDIGGQSVSLHFVRSLPDVHDIVVFTSNATTSCNAALAAVVLVLVAV